MKRLLNIIKGIFSTESSSNDYLQKSLDSNNNSIDMLEKAAGIVVENYSDALDKIDSMIEFIGEDSGDLLKSTLDQLYEKRESLDKSYKEESRVILGQLEELKKANASIIIKINQESELNRAREIESAEKSVPASNMTREEFDQHCITVVQARSEGLIPDDTWGEVVKSIQSIATQFTGYSVIKS